MQQALAKQGKRGPSIHCPFDELELRDLPFHLSIAFLSAEGRFHSRSVSLNPLSELSKLSDGTGLGCSQPGGKCTNVSLPQYFDEVLGQIQGGCHFRMQ
jgi:hypothetical protein